MITLTGPDLVADCEAALAGRSPQKNEPRAVKYDTIEDDMKRLTAFLKSTLLKYGVSSVLSFVVDYGMFALLIALNCSIMVSTYAARACSCVVNFLLNRNGVFRSGGDPVLQFIQYILLVICAATVSGLAVTFLAAHLPLPAIVLKFFVEVILFFANYLIQKKFIFRD